MTLPLPHGYVGFDSWDALLRFVDEARGSLFYRAPLDIRPQRVSVRRRGKRLRVEPWTSDADPFWADSKHLERFCRIAQ